MASTTKATTEAIAASSNASNNQTNSNEVVDPSSNSSAAVAQSSATSVSTISQLKAAPVVSPSSAAAISIASSGTVSKPLSNQATSSIGTAVNAKQVRGGSAAAKPGSATGSKALGVKPAHKGVVSPDTGKARGGAMPKPTTPSTTGSAKSASGQRKASNDRPVSAIAGAQKGPNASLSSNANAMTAKKGGAEGRTSTTTSAAAVSRDRPLTASHAGAMSNASGSKKENTSQSDPAATLVVVGLPPTTSLEQVRQLFEKNWTLANSRQVLPKGPKDPFGNQVYITFNQATDADMALDVLNYKPLNGKPLRLVKATNLQKMIDPSLGLRISNLPTEVNEEQIQDTFSALGEVISIELQLESNGLSKGVAIVHFAEKEISSRVLELFSGKTLGANTMYA